MQSLALYDQMCTAIAECAQVDEAKDIRDKAMALEAYFRQAKNLDAEREATNVRLRAERRSGELLKELTRATPAEAASRGNDVRWDRMSDDGMRDKQSPYAEALDRTGMSRQTAHRFQALADVPQETFDRALRAPEKPSSAALLKHNEARDTVRNPVREPVVSGEALTIWGHLRDFERHGFPGSNWSIARASMTDAMRADIRRLIPVVRDVMDELEDAFVIT